MQTRRQLWERIISLLGTTSSAIVRDLVTRAKARLEDAEECTENEILSARLFNDAVRFVFLAQRLESGQEGQPTFDFTEKRCELWSVVLSGLESTVDWEARDLLLKAKLELCEADEIQVHDPRQALIRFANAEKFTLLAIKFDGVTSPTTCPDCRFR